MMEISRCDEAKWYVAQVKPSGFARAEANLVVVEDSVLLQLPDIIRARGHLSAPD